MDRRDFLETAVGATLGAAFAAAAQPVMADSVIVTDSAGLQADVVQIKSGGQTLSAYRAQPEGKKNLPVILVVSEIFGVHQHIADIARRFAKLGYLAIAPDLFARQGDPSTYTAIPDLIKNIVAKVPDAQAMQDLDACVSWAAEHGGDIKRLGVTGFCWGGRITWMYAAHNPKVQTAVAWYGKLVNEKNALQPHTAIEIAPELRVPVLGLYGGKDSSIPQDTVERMRAALATGGSGSEIVVYPDAGHAFYADYRPSYAATDAKDGWLRCVGWLRKFGV